MKWVAEARGPDSLAVRLGVSRRGHYYAEAEGLMAGRNGEIAYARRRWGIGQAAVPGLRRLIAGEVVLEYADSLGGAAIRVKPRAIDALDEVRTLASQGLAWPVPAPAWRATRRKGGKAR